MRLRGQGDYEANSDSIATGGGVWQRKRRWSECPPSPHDQLLGQSAPSGTLGSYGLVMMSDSFECRRIASSACIENATDMG